jgi:hypothetical protein
MVRTDHSSDLEAVLWLQEYIQNYRNTVLLVSHDRYVVCHVLPPDIKKLTIDLLLSSNIIHHCMLKSNVKLCVLSCCAQSFSQ